MRNSFPKLESVDNALLNRADSEPGVAPVGVGLHARQRKHAGALDALEAERAA